MIVALVKVTGILLTALAVSRAMSRASAGAGTLSGSSPWAQQSWFRRSPSGARSRFACCRRASSRLPGRHRHGGTRLPRPETRLRSSPPRSRRRPHQPHAPQCWELLSPGSTWPGPGTNVLLVVWSVVALALVGRLGHRGICGAAHREAGAAARHPLATPLYDIADRLGLAAAPRLLCSEDVSMPFAAGLAAPTIVLPAESDEWTADRRSAVMIHELGAHPAPRPRGPHARPHRLRALLVPSADLDCGGAG